MIVTAIVLAALLAAVSLSVDIGNLSSTKRNLQTIADAAAMDARFALGTSTACSQAIGLADASAANNGFSPTGSGNTLTVTLGTATVAGNTETFASDGASCEAGGGINGLTDTAVQVTAAGNVKFFFEPGSSTPQAKAVWAKGGAPETGVSIGTALLGINAANSNLLSPILTGLFGPNSNVNLQAVGYQGLANSSVTLGQLAAALNLGSVSQLLTTTVSYPQLLQAEAQALGAGPQGPSVQAGLSVLNGLIALPQVGGAFPIDFTLGQLLNVQDPGASSTANIGVNALNLLTSAVEFGHGPSAINVSYVNLGIPDLSNVSVTASIIQPAQMAFGPVGTKATDAQVALTVSAYVSVAGLAAVTVPLKVTLAQGTATITAIPCNPTPPTFSIVTNTASLYLGSAPGTQPGPVDVSVSGGVSVAEAYGPFGIGAAGTQVTNGPYPEQIPGQGTDLTGANLGGSLIIDVIGAPLGSLLDTVVLPTLASDINPVVDNIVNPLLDELGVAVGGGVVGNPDPVTPTTCTDNGFLF